jgi:hypothetical protein
MRIRLRTLLGLVVAIALALAFFASFVHTPAWHRADGMIGWSQAAIESRLGPPSQVFERDVADLHIQSLISLPPGTYRTLVFSRFDGRFVAWLRAEEKEYVCVRSSWVEKGTY